MLSSNAIFAVSIHQILNSVQQYKTLEHGDSTLMLPHLFCKCYNIMEISVLQREEFHRIYISLSETFTDNVASD